MTAEPGRWRNDRTPYLVGLMDATCEENVEEIVFLKAVQVGFSECIRNMLGFWIDHDPGPTLLVMPSQQAAEELVDERIRPLLQDTPALRKHVSDNRADNKLSAIRLATMSVYTAWAGSPQALASRPIRRVLFDEVDKYPAFSGKEADPISLGRKRLTTYRHRSLAVIGSTPTTRIGPIWTAWERCTERRRFWVPCPKCGEHQTLRWSQVKWPQGDARESREQHAERVEAQALALYECEHCGEQWTDDEKSAAVKHGEWRAEPGSDGPRRIGFHLNSIYSPWVTLSKLAGEWIRAQDNPAALMDFANSRLAEPFEEQGSTLKPSLIEEKATHAGPPMVCPSWGQILLCTADVQKDHLYYTVRAWGYGWRSQLVTAGIASDFGELERVAFRTQYGQHAHCHLLGIDSRYRTDEVLAFAERFGGRVWPFVGDANPKAAPLRSHAVKGYRGVIRRTINPNIFKDQLHGLMTSDDVTQWLPHNAPDPAYCKQMASEHKIHDPKKGVWTWQTVSQRADNHYWDTEVLQVAMAQECGVSSLTEEALKQPQQPTRERERPGGWATGHRNRW